MDKKRFTLSDDEKLEILFKGIGIGVVIALLIPVGILIHEIFI